MATIKDNRTEAEKAATIGFWVATDRFMSGWGKACKGRSLVACPVVSASDADEVEKVFQDRSEFKHIRFVGKDWNPRLNENDQLHIYNTTTSFRRTKK